MEIGSLPQKILEVLLRDAIDRDLATARRTAILNIMLHERFLRREQLIVRVEGLIGKGCFGASAWEDVFYRDMRIVKAALNAAGYQLGYSRKATKPGYYLRGQPPISAELSEILKRSAAEADPAQILIFRNLTPAERFHLACSISDTARNVVVYRTRQRFPELSLSEASYFALQGRFPG